MEIYSRESDTIGGPEMVLTREGVTDLCERIVWLVHDDRMVCVWGGGGGGIAQN